MYKYCGLVVLDLCPGAALDIRRRVASEARAAAQLAEGERRLGECAHMKCGALGGNSVAFAVTGKHYIGPDGDAGFCEVHFKELMPIYREFKDAEKEVGCAVLWDRHCNLEDWTLEFLTMWHHNVTRIIRLRESFQARLARPMGYGHALWMSGLANARDRLASAVPQGWVKVQGRKKG